ncbi:MAG: VOC family protein [Verrucomicrobia bacterium]|nr:VOC family protein [Pseudomonadota bacterium]NBS05809.1 VOC family protein [Verrucomicrobiota bacterium]NBS78230.1 VOC family protein [bacterium]NBS49002.1 VOC family protein [Verrucomicrobiota bacterium]NBT23034.1 VOC family protein [bacterium]
MNVGRWLHTRLRVEDLSRSREFFQKVLGLVEISQSVSPRGSSLVFLQSPAGGEMLELCQFPSSGPVQVPPDLIHVAFEVDDLDAFGRHAAGHGYPWSDGPTSTAGGTRFAFLDAPDGYEIEIIERRSAQ